MFTEFTDIVPSFFGWLNQGPMTLTLFLQIAIVRRMSLTYNLEKRGEESENTCKSSLIVVEHYKTY